MSLHHRDGQALGSLLLAGLSPQPAHIDYEDYGNYCEDYYYGYDDYE